MGRIVSINLGTEDIRVAVASLVGGTFRIEQTHRMTDRQLDDFLAVDANETYVVSAAIDELYQEILHLPPADEKLLDKLIAAEIRRLHPDAPAHSFFHEVIGEVHHGGKPLKKVVCFVYATRDLAPVIASFSRHGKLISHLFSDAYSLTQLVANSSATTSEPVLCISSSPGSKLLFLLESDRLHFVRHIQSTTAGIDAIDLQNINMTIDHCFQNLRAKPRSMVLLGSQEADGGVAAETMLPLQGRIFCRGVTATPEALEDFYAPVGALLCLNNQNKGNLLPQSYREGSFILKTLRTGTYAIAALCLLLLAGIAMKSHSLLDLQGTVARQRAVLKGIDLAVAEYSQVEGEFSRAAPTIAILNSAAAAASQDRPFVALDCLAVTGIHPTSLTMNRKDGDRLAIEVKGEVSGESYAGMQSAYERLISNIRRSGNLEIVSHKMDPAAKSFSLALLYRG